jgi:transcriptional regulator with XRE-family HTH domain
MAAQELFRLERFLRKVTQDEISKETGLPQSTISRIERGLRPAKPEEREALARALGLSPADLFPTQEAQP